MERFTQHGRARRSHRGGATRKARLWLIGLGVVGVLASWPSGALAEVDAVYPEYNWTGWGRGGVAKVEVNWSAYSAAFEFSRVTVWDTLPDGYCVVPMVNVDRRFQPNSGWMYLGGGKLHDPISGYTYAFGLTCGDGRRFSDDNVSIYTSRTPVRELTGIRGVWLTLCLAHGGVDSLSRPKADIVACGPTRYAANDGR